MAKSRRGRGEGRVEQLPSGNWRAQISGSSADGKRIREGKTFATKSLALAWIRDRLSQGKTTISSRDTLECWINQWLAIRKGKIERQTYDADRWLCEKHVTPRIGKTPLRQLTPMVVEQFLAQMATDGRSQSERHKAGATLRKALNAAVKAGLIPASPMAGIRLPAQPAAKITPLSREQAQHLIATAESMGHGHIFRLWLDAGLRPSELLGLTWGDIHWQTGEVWVQQSLDEHSGKLKATKTKRSNRRIPLASSTLESLKQAYPGNPSEPITSDKRGGHRLLRNFTRIVFKPVVTRADCPQTRPYDMRHTMATLMLQAGVPVKVVSERLGHEDITTTLRCYCHVMPGMQSKAAETWESLIAPRLPHASDSASGEVP